MIKNQHGSERQPANNLLSDLLPRIAARDEAAKEELIKMVSARLRILISRHAPASMVDTVLQESLRIVLLRLGIQEMAARELWHFSRLTVLQKIAEERRNQVEVERLLPEFDAISQKSLLYKPERHFLPIAEEDWALLVKYYLHGYSSVDLSEELGISREFLDERLGNARIWLERSIPSKEAVSVHADLWNKQHSQHPRKFSLASLREIATEIMDLSTNPEATDFSVDDWLTRWIQVPQPTLDYMTPSAVLETPGGLYKVRRVLGAIQSGAYL